MFFVYLLLCSDNSLYTGISPDPQKRLATHQKGRGGAYTRSHPPLRLVYSESHPNRSSALRREAEIKSWPRSQKIIRLHLQLHEKPY